MTPAQLRRLCLRLSGAEETFPFGPETSVFKVGGKMFAIAPLQRKPLMVSVKCEPELGEQLRGTYDEIEPGYHLNKRHWLTVTCGGAASDDLVRELVAGSYDLVGLSRAAAIGSRAWTSASRSSPIRRSRAGSS